MKAPANNLIFIARVCVNESRSRRLRMSHLPHQVAFSWSLLNSAANFRRQYIESKKPVQVAQGSLF
jgi:hypothetical protein